METAYIEKYSDDGNSYKKLCPTGRWKIETNPCHTNMIFVEHKWFIFKRWVSEDDIVFRPDAKIEIFDCKR